MQNADGKKWNRKKKCHLLGTFAFAFYFDSLLHFLHYFFWREVASRDSFLVRKYLHDSGQCFFSFLNRFMIGVTANNSSRLIANQILYFFPSFSLMNIIENFAKDIFIWKCFPPDETRFSYFLFHWFDLRTPRKENVTHLPSCLYIFRI